MAGFNFKLEKVLNYKEILETQKKSKFAQVKQRLIKEEELLDDFFNHKNELIKEKNISSKEIKVWELSMYNSYIDMINRKINQQQTIVKRTKEELKKVKDEMIDSVKEKKVFEKLKENEYEKFMYEQKKNEEKLVDNLISYKNSTRN